MAFGVLVQGFDFRDLHLVLAEEGEGLLDQGAAQALALICGVDGQIGNPADFTLMVQPGGDVAGNATGVVAGDEYAFGLDVAIVGDGGELSGLPGGVIPLPELAQDFLHIAVDGDGAEGGGGDFVEAQEIGRDVGANGEHEMNEC